MHRRDLFGLGLRLAAGSFAAVMLPGALAKPPASRPAFFGTTHAQNVDFANGDAVIVQYAIGADFGLNAAGEVVVTHTMHSWDGGKTWSHHVPTAHYSISRDGKVTQHT